MAEFMRLRERLEHEMEERFDSQDEIIDSLSQSIKTFQDTMKIVGETVCWKGFSITQSIGINSNRLILFIFHPINFYHLSLINLS